ncbi:hypothetical protein TWF730_000223 [Orbilia blumenaviensis]|uniref:Peptidase S8/S53 domain-containing protein n=1 Tax=Orbilia blumenaviensis TaxID=1796055 RepID=A0AAV9VN57_9PEZI
MMITIILIDVFTTFQFPNRQHDNLLLSLGLTTGLITPIAMKGNLLVGLAVILYGLLAEAAPVSDEDEAPPSKYSAYKPPKVGRWNTEKILCPLNPGFRHDNPTFELINDMVTSRPVSQWIMSPRKYSYFPIKSEYIGTWAYIFTVGPANRPTRAVVNRLTLDMKAYFQSIDEEYPFELCFIGYAYPTAIVMKKKPSDFYAARKAAIEYHEAALAKRPKRLKREFIRRGTLTRLETKEEVVAGVGLPGVPEISFPRAPIELYNEFSTSEVGKVTYFHYSSAGEGVVVYVVDSGCALGHNEIKPIIFQDYINAGDFPGDPFTDGLTSGIHGTQMVTKIAGRTSGIARKASIVMVAIRDGEFLMSLASILDGLMKMYDHIQKYNSNRPCIINISARLTAVFTPTGQESGTNLRILKLENNIMKRLLERFTNLKNVVIVTGAGNDKPGTPINSYPQVLPRFFPNSKVVVVGAASVDGLNMAQYDDTIPNFVWAPGQGVLQISDPDLMPWDKYPNLVQPGPGGTSIAAAATSGLLATFLARDTGEPEDRIERGIELLLKLSWKRNPKGVPIIHNGITPAQWPQSMRETFGITG